MHRQIKIFNNSTIFYLAGIYIHIPFCKQACSYCNFHFTTSLRRKNELVDALLGEIELRKDYLSGEPIETIYFGGGTPSLLDKDELRRQVEEIFSSFDIIGQPEVTIEANPDDVIEESLREWKAIGINRLSIGVQSFWDEDLKWMNRAHSAAEAEKSLQLATKHFDNISVDLIYGLTSLKNERWRQNVDRAISYQIPHLSCYALTVEPKTPLHKRIMRNETDGVDPDKQSEQFLSLMQWMEEAGYEHYEISNFAKPAFRSRHNSSYWKGKKYLGIGPSAHSYNGIERQWNTPNNNVYINSIKRAVIPYEKEILTPIQKLNEYIMTSLRTTEGLNLNQLSEAIRHEIQRGSKKFFERGLLVDDGSNLKLTTEGKLLADGIASDLFFSERTMHKILS